MKIHAIPAVDTAMLALGQSMVGQSSALDFFIRLAAEWLVYFVPVVLAVLWLWYRYGAKVKDWQERRVRLIEFTAAGLLGWQVLSSVIKLFVYRDRPTEAGSDVKELFFHRPNNSFPSDHTAFFVSLTAFCYAMGWTRAGNWLLIATLCVSAARIATGVHWFTDILAGAVVGIAAGLLMAAWVPWFRRRISAPLERLACRIGL